MSAPTLLVGNLHRLVSYRDQSRPKRLAVPDCRRRRPRESRGRARLAMYLAAARRPKLVFLTITGYRGGKDLRRACLEPATSAPRARGRDRRG